MKVVFPTGAIPQYKYYIGKGNNSMLVRAALKTRFWWSMGVDFDEWEEYNFIWTQWKSNKILACIKGHQEPHGLKSEETSILSTQTTATTGG